MQQAIKGQPKKWWRIGRFLIIPTGVILVLFIIVQILFPNTHLPFFSQVGGIDLSVWGKASATIALDQAYNDATIGIYFGDNEKPYREVKPAEIGLKISNQRRINQMGYPWYIRLVPTSLLWWGLVAPEPKLNLDYDDTALNGYLKSVFGKKCLVEPINASLSISGENIHLTSASVGGRCNFDLVEQELKKINFLSASQGEVRIEIDETEPAVSTQDALALADKVGKNMVSDLELGFDDYDDSVTLKHQDLISWLSFAVVDDKLTVVIDETKSAEFYRGEVAPLVETSAGVTTIIASDLDNITREDGLEGQVINIQETNLRIAEYLMDERRTVTVAVESTDPTIEYVYERPVVQTSNTDRVETPKIIKPEEATVESENDATDDDDEAETPLPR
jgi:hypothetical protein